MLVANFCYWINLSVQNVVTTLEREVGLVEDLVTVRHIVKPEEFPSFAPAKYD